MKCCINNVNFIRLLLLSTELFKFEIQKYGQILCAHKPYFLMPGHIYSKSIQVQTNSCLSSSDDTLITTIGYMVQNKIIITSARFCCF